MINLQQNSPVMTFPQSHGFLSSRITFLGNFSKCVHCPQACLGSIACMQCTELRPDVYIIHGHQLLLIGNVICFMEIELLIGLYM